MVAVILHAMSSSTGKKPPPLVVPRVSGGLQPAAPGFKEWGVQVQSQNDELINMYILLNFLNQINK